MSHTETTVLHVYPAQQCAHCPRLTDGAIIMEGIFSPVCPLHGYIHPCNPLSLTHAERERQFESIKRFVLWMYGDQGHAMVISPVYDVHMIPGYQERPEQEIEEDRAFYVGYISPAGEHAEVYVLWSGTAEQFFLYQNGKEIHDRFCTWLESRAIA